LYKGKRVAAIVLARRGSRRLADKMLLPFAGATVLESVLARVKDCRLADDWLLATTVNPADDPLAELGRRAGFPVFRGSENDVVERLVQAAASLPEPPDAVLRINADNPLFMPELVDEGLRQMVDLEADLITPFEFNTYPFGYAMVGFTRDCLQRIDAGAQEAVYREHVENFCFERPAEFRTLYQAAPAELYGPGHSVTLDYPADYEKLLELSAALKAVPLAKQPRELLARLNAAGPGLPQMQWPGWRPEAQKRGSGSRFGFATAEAAANPAELLIIPPDGATSSSQSRSGLCDNPKFRSLLEEVKATGGQLLIAENLPEKETLALVKHSAELGLKVLSKATSPTPEQSVFQQLVLTADGRYLSHARAGGLEVGRLGEKTLAEIWTGPAMVRARVAALNARLAQGAGQ